VPCQKRNETATAWPFWRATTATVTATVVKTVRNSMVTFQVYLATRRDPKYSYKRLANDLARPSHPGPPFRDGRNHDRLKIPVQGQRTGLPPLPPTPPTRNTVIAPGDGGSFRISRCR
jgi:hypothetical protein